MADLCRFYGILFYLLGFMAINQASGQSISPNLAMHFDGEGDYIQLPSDLFDGLDEFTVEAWIQWESFGFFSQPWGFGSSRPGDVIGLNNDHFSSTLQFFIYEGWNLQLIQVPDILEKGAWRHIAAVFGHEEMRLYLNGVLVGRHEHQGDFLSTLHFEKNYIGKSHWPTNEDFHGQVDEFRVWSAVRTEREIRESMFSRLKGAEDHLVGLWNFDAGDGADSTAHGNDGILYGDARCVEADLPAVDGLPLPSILSGRIFDGRNLPLQNVNVELAQGVDAAASASTDSDGRYMMVFYPDSAPYDLAATLHDQGNWKLQFHISPGESRILDITLHPAVSITGTLLAYDNSPLSGIPVQALQETDSGEYRKTTVLCDDNGHYQFVNLRPGKCRLRCYVGDQYVYFGQNANSEFTQKEGECLQIELSRSITDLDFHFAPFKKGLWRSYSYLDGLASNHVTSIENDGLGRIWFGTDAGISRFDGVNFVTLTKQDGLVSNEIITIYRDRDGWLWIGASEGLSQFDGKKFVNFTKQDGLAGNWIYTIFQDSQKRLWIGTDGGASLYDGEKFINVTKKEGLSANEVYAITEDGAGVVWFGTISGLTSYDGHKFRIYTVEDGLVNNEVHALYRDAHNVLWIGAKKGVSRFDGRTFSNFTAADGLSNEFIHSIEEDADGRIWFAAENGVSRYDGRGFVTFYPKDGLAHYRVASVHRDIHGILWFATLQNGISRYDDHSLVNFTVQDGLTHNTVWAIAEEASGIMWLGTNNGLTRFDSQTFTNFSGRNGLPEDKITCLYSTSDGALWIGTWTKGLFRYDGKSVKIFDRSNGLATDRVTVICKGNDGMLWIGHSAGGISRLDSETLAVQSVIYPRGFNNLHTRSIYPAGGGLTWIGMTEWGLWRYEDGRFSNLNSRDGLLDNHVEAIHPGLDGLLWLATEEGVSRFDGERFFDLTKKDGLADNKINVIEQDRQGRLWLGAQSAGVMVHDGTMWSTLDVRDGLASNTIYAIHEDQKGFFWLGSEQGLSRYYPRSSSPTVRILSLQGDEKYTDLSIAPSLIGGRRLSIDYEAIDLKTMSDKHQYYVRIRRSGEAILSAPAKSSVFNWTPAAPGWYTFEVQAVDQDLNFSPPAQVAFRVVSPWYLNAKITIPSLAALLGLIGAVIVLGLYVVANRRKARQLFSQLLDNERERNLLLQKSKDAAEAASQTKSIFLANMSHDIRTPLNAILGYAQILLRKTNMPVETRSALSTIAESGNHLLSLINDILDLSKIEAGCMDLNLTDFDLVHCIEGFSSMFGFRCVQKGLAWRVEWNQFAKQEGKTEDQESFPSMPPRRIVHADEGKLRKILTNLLSNAVKFTDSGEVILRITVSPFPMQDIASDQPEASSFTFEVIDTGIGIPADAHELIFEAFAQEAQGKPRGGSGLGLAIAKQHVELMGGHIGMESTPGKGSRFFFDVQLMSGTAASVPGAGETWGDERSRIVRLADGCHVRALVVDDLQENRDVLAQFLRDVGVNVIARENGKQALEAVEAFSPDIVFMDIRMPEMDGLTAAKHLLQMTDKPSPKLVAVSASALIQERQKYLENGFEEFMAKPISANQVYNVLAHLLHVQFEYEQSGADMENFKDVSVPAELLSQLRSAAELYNTTKLKQILNQVETLGEDGRKFAEHLRHWIERSELEAIISVLEQIEGNES